MKRKLTAIVMLLVLAFCGALYGCGGGGGETGNKKEIVIDGGGDIGNFNTTVSMTASDANPFPYNTLRTLCDEWEALNPDYKVTINTTSTGGDRGTMIPLLNQKRAPDISYQNGTVINSDLGKDWYVELSSYLAQPNKYAPEYATWADVYGDELTGTMAADGGYYYLCLEKIPVGIVYNKQIFEEAGITKVPETFAELMEAQRLIKANTSKEAFLTTYPWFDIVLENNLFSDLVEQLDVLRPNGMVDTEELVRGYVKGIWNPGKASGDTLTEDSPVFREYLNLIETKNSYYPDSWQTYDAYTNFVNGNLAMLEGTGETFRKLSVNKSISFDYAIMHYPDLTKETTQYAQKPTVRGSAGLATAWFITNSAVRKETVEGCVDLMMYLTAPQNNNRLIGDLKGGIPLNPDESTQFAGYLENLIEVYGQDMQAYKNGDRVLWGALNSWAVLGYEYNTYFIKRIQDLNNGTIEVAALHADLASMIRNTVTGLRVKYEYDETKW